MDEESNTVPAVSPARWGGRLLIGLLLGGLLLLTYFILRDFIVPLVWAAILAYVTWPLNEKLRHLFKKRHGLAALVMTLILTFAIVLPLIAATVAVRQELGDAFDELQTSLKGGGAQIPAWLREFPVVGPRASALANQIAVDPERVGNWLAERATGWWGEAAGVLGIIGRNALKLALALIAVFFVYRDGEFLVADLRHGLSCLLGDRSHDYWTAAATTTRAVVYGLVLTALAQGFVAGLGYGFAGLDAPFLLGAITALLALVPFGAPIVWVTVSAWLLWQGDLWAGVGLLLWGALAVSSIDNFVRPLVISASADISFLLVLIGVLGGVNAFGLVGLFLGPVVLSVLWSVWRHWLEQSDASCPRSPAA